jgi:hypothetical protein
MQSCEMVLLMNNLGVWLGESEYEGRKAVFFIEIRDLEMLI